MKVSLVSGICVQYDAISNAVADQLRWLRNAKYDVKLYAAACDRPELQCSVVSAPWEIVYDPHFQQSELVVFHYGITYPLFDLLPVVPRRARRLVAFHNITPKELVGQAAQATIERSFRQMSNIAFADHAICDSETNLEVLRSARIGTAASVLPLAVTCPPRVPGRKPSADDGIIRVAFIGRLVASKGPRDLLAALHQVLHRMPHVRLELDVVAGLAFSDHAEVGAVRAAADEWPREFDRRATLRLHGDAPEELKQRILAEADLFVLPTRHEGFCVPIVEALGNGCKVIAYANSNTPAISGGHASLVATGDVDTLADALAGNIAQISAPKWQHGGYAEHAQRTWHYTQQFAPAVIEKQFLKQIRQLTRQEG
jgi:glycosyltransferase involved in cell wall biosynthesis